MRRDLIKIRACFSGVNYEEAARVGTVEALLRTTILLHLSVALTT